MQIFRHSSFIHFESICYRSLGLTFSSSPKMVARIKFSLSVTGRSFRPTAFVEMETSFQHELKWFHDNIILLNAIHGTTQKIIIPTYKYNK